LAQDEASLTISDEQPPELRASDPLAHARACYARRDWADAFAAFVQSDALAALEVEDLERCTWSAMLTGHDDDVMKLSERLHQAHVEAGAVSRAARWAFWAGFRSLALGEMGRANGWLARAERHVERLDGACAERGYLLIPVVYKLVAAGDFAGAYELSSQAVEIGERYADRDLVAFARNMQGRNLLRQGRVDEGLALMDEAMLAATSGELEPVMTGLLYCSLIAGCHQAFALDRAREWTHVLERWWQAQPQVVAFTASCLVHRAELLQLRGSWGEAIDEAARATSAIRCAIERQAAADGYYQQGEIHRLRGDHTRAEAAYGEASRLGREPQPGLALLWLAQGRSDAAVGAIRRVLLANRAPLTRAQFLPAFCEIMLAAGELDEMRGACLELAEIARTFGNEVLTAMAGHARSSLYIAEGDPGSALEPLRDALAVWQRVSAPYIVARLRVLLARACRALGDEESAALELGAAREAFEQLGAAPDLARLEEPSRLPAAAGPSGTRLAPAKQELSPRELEVLRHVAAGKTNKQIARELGLSEKTIDRHVSNILMKLDVPSRAAATAYAYQHALV
jgi:DNA-binding CsgD family transcriptional regulator